jgi:hypothetical protein
MISAAPLSAAGRFQDFSDQIKAFLATAKLSAVDGLTWSEFGELLVALLRLGVGAAELLDVPGPERKELVLEAVAVLFDTVADKCVPVVLWPVWLIARSSIRSLVLELASGAIEQILFQVRLK